MHSEVLRYIKVAAMLGLFSDLMKFTVVNESLSINNLMFCKENNSTVSKTISVLVVISIPHTL